MCVINLCVIFFVCDLYVCVCVIYMIFVCACMCVCVCVNMKKYDVADWILLIAILQCM